MKNKFRIWAIKISFICGSIISGWIVSNLILKHPKLSLNDLHLIWIVDGRHFFVRSLDTDPQTIEIELHPELQRLGNVEIPKFKFKKDKNPSTFRIFCVGGSTTRGWPFHVRLSYPKLLSLYLKDLLPDKKIEVINTGLMGSDSFSDIKLVKEILKYQPDLILLYEGRNDEWNISLHVGKRAQIIKLHVWLLKHLYFYSFLKNHFFPEKKYDLARDIRNFTLKGLQVNRKIICKHLGDNLKKIKKIVSPYCKIAVLTQVASLQEIKNKSTIIYVNQFLRRLTKKEKIPLIDVEEAFERSGKDLEELVIPGAVHPDLEGYILMAKIICKALEQHKLIPNSKWKWENLKPDSYYLNKLHVTNTFLYYTYLNVVEVFTNIYFSPPLAKKYAQKAKFYKNMKQQSIKIQTENKHDSLN